MARGSSCRRSDDLRIRKRRKLKCWQEVTACEAWATATSSGRDVPPAFLVHVVTVDKAHRFYRVRKSLERIPRLRCSLRMQSCCRAVLSWKLLGRAGLRGRPLEFSPSARRVRRVLNSLCGLCSGNGRPPRESGRLKSVGKASSAACLQAGRARGLDAATRRYDRRVSGAQS